MYVIIAPVQMKEGHREEFIEALVGRWPGGAGQRRARLLAV